MMMTENLVLDHLTPSEPPKRRFTDYAALGSYIKEQNPAIDLDDDRVGRAYVARFPDKYDVGPSMAKQISSAIAAPFGQISRFSSGRSPGLPDGGIDVLGTGADLLRRSAKGIVSGASLGLSDAINRGVGPGTGPADNQDRQDRNSIAFGTGQLIAEVAGPYRLMRGLFGAKMAPKGATWARRALAGGSEAAAVEGSKGLIDDKKTVLESAAIGFLGGVASEAVVAGSVGAARMAADRLIKPAGKYAKDVVEWLRELDMPVLPTIAYPMSNVTAAVQEKVQATAANMAAIKAVQHNLTAGLLRARERFIGQMGGNAGLKDPLESGQALYTRVTEVMEHLKAETRELYRGLSDTQVGLTSIHPNQKYQRVVDGAEEPTETTLWESFREALGDHADEFPKDQPEPLKVLHRIFNKAKADHKTVDVTVSESTDPGKMVTQPRRTAPASSTIINRGHQRSHLNPNQRFSPAAGQHTGVGPDDYQSIWKTESGGGSTFERAEVQLPLKTYNYWWGVTKKIGDQMDTPAYRENATVKRVVDSAYHAVQDAMDHQASQVSPTFSAAIIRARQQAQAHFAYRDLPLVKQTLSSPKRLRSAEMIDELFLNTETVLQSKRLLGPEEFNQARQAWLRNLLDRSVEIGMDELGDPVKFRGLWTQIAKKGGGGTDSQFIKEVFSEDNFFDYLKGEKIPAATGGEAKRELLTRFYDKFREIDDMIGQVAPGKEAFGGSGTERGGLASFVNPSDLAGTFAKWRALAFQLISSRRLGEEFFKENPAENIFMQKVIPNWEGNVNAMTMKKGGEWLLKRAGLTGPSMGVSRQLSLPSQISSPTRQATTSAGLSRLLNRD
tara:strand:- start:1192 stop:3714 length:2523 start_codon:yes stop_codon:yes gene_type:complete